MKKKEKRLYIMGGIFRDVCYKDDVKKTYILLYILSKALEGYDYGLLKHSIYIDEINSFSKTKINKIDAVKNIQKGIYTYRGEDVITKVDWDADIPYFEINENIIKGGFIVDSFPLDVLKRMKRKILYRYCIFKTLIGSTERSPKLQYKPETFINFFNIKTKKADLTNAHFNLIKEQIKFINANSDIKIKLERQKGRRCYRPSYYFLQVSKQKFKK